jgi:hypothetical protein
LEADSRNIAEILQSCIASRAPEHWELFIKATRRLIAASIGRTLRQWSSAPEHLVDDLTQEVYLILCKDSFLGACPSKATGRA